MVAYVATAIVNTCFSLAHTMGIVGIRQCIGGIISSAVLLGKNPRAGLIMTPFFGYFLIVTGIDPAINSNGLITENGEVVPTTDFPIEVSRYRMHWK